MPERGFDTGFWSDPFVQELPQEGKTLFLYLWTNDHCNPAGLYGISLKTIAFETGLPQADIPGMLETIEPKVRYYPEENLIWVKNFIKRQSKSSKFLAAVAKSLVLIHHNRAIQDLLEYNISRYSISIPYQYYMDRISILAGASVSVSDSVSVSEERKGIAKGEGSEEKEPSEAEVLFNLWNTLGVVKHRKLTGDMKRAFKATSRDFTAAEISQAMKNYATIVNDEQCYFDYRWDLQDFLKRGLRKFLDLSIALKNYQRGDNNARPQQGAPNSSVRTDGGFTPEQYAADEAAYKARHHL